MGGPNPGAQFGGATPQAVLKRVRAKFPWDEAAGASPEDLTFRKGDIIEIVDEINPGQGWYTGRCEARAGIFPGNYVDMINPLPIEPAAPSPPINAALPVPMPIDFSYSNPLSRLSVCFSPKNSHNLVMSK